MIAVRVVLLAAATVAAAVMILALVNGRELEAAIASFIGATAILAVAGEILEHRSRR